LPTIRREFLNIRLFPEGKAEVLRKFNDYFYFGGFPEGAELSIKREYLTSVYQFFLAILPPIMQ
jgi:predicted AAA+ superfamily ATPase